MTETIKATPGPWHASATHLGAAYDIGAADGSNVALVSGLSENGAEEFVANANLIAAAPDLLAALRKIIAEDDTGPMVYEPRQVGMYTVSQAIGGSEGKFATIARAAIAKAEGRS